MEITEEGLEAIKERSYNLGAINTSLDNITYYLQSLNNSLDKSQEGLNELKRRMEAVDGVEGIDS